MATSAAPATTRAGLAQLVRYFLYLGAFGFGGGLAIVPLLHQNSSSGSAGSTSGSSSIRCRWR